MIQISSFDKLEEKYLSEHPSWDRSALKAQAEDFVMHCDSRLEEVVENYISRDVESDYCQGEFSLFLIRAMRPGCSFLEAVMLMDAYLKDPLHGKALIIRR